MGCLDESVLKVPKWTDSTTYELNVVSVLGKIEESHQHEPLFQTSTVDLLEGLADDLTKAGPQGPFQEQGNISEAGENVVESYSLPGQGVKDELPGHRSHVPQRETEAIGYGALEDRTIRRHHDTRHDW